MVEATGPVSGCAVGSGDQLTQLGPGVGDTPRFQYFTTTELEVLRIISGYSGSCTKQDTNVNRLVESRW